MPKKKIVSKDSLDRFYTNPEVAKQCIETLLPYVYPESLFVEPSAGSGSFFLQLPERKIGIDIAPACEGVLQSDWLEYQVPVGCVIVGNPPFGTRNKLTNQFIKHSIAGGAETIAFVLPAVYRKETMQRIFPEGWKLVSDTELGRNSFLLDNEPYHVPCVFQIWHKHSDLPDLRESVKEKATTEDFTFCDRDQADYFMFGAAPQRVISPADVNMHNRGYWIKASPEVADKLRQINWKQHALSSVNGGAAWFVKQQLIDIYIKAK